MSELIKKCEFISLLGSVLAFLVSFKLLSRMCLRL
jgi:hypothetical protein